MNWLFAENETNTERIVRAPNGSAYVNDGIDEAVVRVDPVLGVLPRGQRGAHRREPPDRPDGPGPWLIESLAVLDPEEALEECFAAAMKMIRGQ